MVILFKFNTISFMKNFKSQMLVLIACIAFISCGKNKVEDNTLNDQINQEQEMARRDTINPQKPDSIAQIDKEQTKGTILGERRFIKKKGEKSIVDVADSNAINAPKDVETKTTTTPISTTSSSTTSTKKVVAPSNFTIQKILNGCAVGITLTQEELSKNLAIPKEAIKLVKSITKISDDEIEIKWNSTWLVEKISDAKFNDGRLKVRFASNKMYTSGNAIGIKYDKKLYTDLVVYGRAAHIPSVKGFYWQIGKDK